MAFLPIKTQNQKLTQLCNPQQAAAILVPISRTLEYAYDMKTNLWEG
jgi:hypothetical protein